MTAKTKDREAYTAFYQGACPRCSDTIDASFTTFEGIVPPPSIGVACGCDIPVAPVSLVYRNSQTQ